MSKSGKGSLLDAIRSRLKQEFETLSLAAQAAHEAATHAESKPDDKHDTRSTEASYLAGAQAIRAAEIQSMIEFYSRLEPRDYGSDEAIGPGALVSVAPEGGKPALYFLAALGGGIVVQWDGKTVQIITPKSPVGEELMGRKRGETFEVELRGQSREMEIVSVA